MLKKYKLLAAVMAIFSVMFIGCDSDFGKVDQGRVIEYNKETKTVTIIRDKSLDTMKPDYSYLPPITYTLPTDPNEMGPEPKAGKRMKLDIDKKQLVVYAQALSSFVTINYTLIENGQKNNIGDNDPLVYDVINKKPKQFPIVDLQNKTISIYSKRQKILVTFKVPDEYFVFPADTWDSGDEVRIYFKQEGKASRFMNVTKTDIFKK